MKILIIYTVLIFLFINFKNINSSEKNYFNEAVNFFEKKKFKKAKFKFEQDIVFNPKSELSYLYLSKIFKKQNKKKLEEQNLNTVMLLNPKNEEAILNLALLKKRKSNYTETKKLIKDLKKVCKTLCQETSDLEKRLDALLKK